MSGLGIWSIRTKIHQVVEDEFSLGRTNNYILMNDFYLVYQPKVRANKIIAVEALLRPYHTDIESYFHSLNDTLSLDRKVIIECCREFNEHDLIYPVSLNVHPTSLLDDEFVDFCIETLNDRMVTLELIETQNIKVCDQLRHNSFRLQNNNIKLSIDDFCFEYSRLDLAMEIETNEIKFDGSLIQDIESSFFKFKYLATLHAKLCNFGIKSIVFEKVETKRQNDLINFFCKDAIIQGYYYYKPMKMEKLLNEELTICDSYNESNKSSLKGIQNMDFFVYQHIVNAPNYNKKTVNEVIREHDKLGTVYNGDENSSISNLRDIYFNSEDVVNNSVMRLFHNADKLMLIRNSEGVVIYDNLSHQKLVNGSLIGIAAQTIIDASTSYGECISVDNLLLSSEQEFLTIQEVFDGVTYGVIREKMYYNDKTFLIVSAAEINSHIISNMPDALTKCYTRVYLDQVLNRYHDKVLGFVDLNGFKNVNDRFGHDIGDKCLIDFVDILKSELRNEDVVIRYGGDEFLILFDSISLMKISARLSYINDMVKKYFEEKSIELSFAHGLVLIDSQNIEQTIKEADARMYKAKEAFKRESTMTFTI